MADNGMLIIKTIKIYHDLVRIFHLLQETKIRNRYRYIFVTGPVVTFFKTFEALSARKNWMPSLLACEHKSALYKPNHRPGYAIHLH
jgi:hypothetical protein